MASIGIIGLGEAGSVYAQAFAQAGDVFKPSDGYVAELLERGVRVLVYVGA